jgi:monothiol glutaredoxin
VTGVDILSNPQLRSEMYVDGEFVGGCDITTQMHQSGELAKLLGSGGGASKSEGQSGGGAAA